MTGLASTVGMPPHVTPASPVFACVACERSGRAPSCAMRAEPASRPFDLVRCPECGLVQQWPRYTAAELRALYAGDYYVFAEEEAERWTRAVQQYVVHLLPLEPARGRRMLDIGCALGHLAALAQARGWRVVGLDLSPQAVSRAATSLGVHVRAGTLSQFRETLPPFDVVVLGDVIEHVPSPVELLKEVREALAPQGVVCIDTPNWGSRWRWIGRSHWLGLNRFHINLFDAEALGRLLARCGYDGVRVGSYTHYRYASWASRPEVQTLVQKLPQAIAWRVNRFLSRFGLASVWGPLREQPPGSLSAAASLVGGFARNRTPLNPSRLSADNLIATAHQA